MKIANVSIVIGCIILIVCGVRKSHCLTERGDMINWIKKPEDLVRLFPQTVTELNQRATCAQKKATAAINDIIAIPDTKRTFANTVQTFDSVAGKSDLIIIMRIAQQLSMLTTDDALRKAAQEIYITLKTFLVENVMYNRALYKAIKYYADHNNTDQLTAEQTYCLTQILKEFKRAGLDLPESLQQKVIALQKELSNLSQQFEENIAADNRTITVTRDQLAGLDVDFINALKKDVDGNYYVGVDYPTYYRVMDDCAVTDTRKRLYDAFNNRAYPANDGILKQVIAKRDELAQLLGFASYAHLNLDDSMVQTPERAQQFLDELIARSSVKEQKEYDLLIQNLPESITLTTDGKFYPWDTAFVKNQYKKKYLSIDEQEVAEYFPMEKTVQGLLDVYRQFFGLDFVAKPFPGLWHADVQLIEVYSSTDHSSLLGYLLLDLYPRDNKFSHACMTEVFPTISSTEHADLPGLAIVIANFTKSTADKPALLTRHFVNTFFHEFGHALHQLLGRTTMATFSGTITKTDFVELPSQMLEEWLWDTEILQKVSGHYKTGQPLPESLIDKIRSLKNFDSGSFVLRQACLAQLSLDCYKAGAIKDVHALVKKLYTTIVPHNVFVENNNMHTSFGHLMGYGAQYYGYMLSKAFAFDLFNEIRKIGLLNSVIGKKYSAAVLAPGGSKDPNDILRDFLGREPNQEAFFKDLGI